MSPTVSVLMPVYNSQRYVALAIKSILAQSFQDFEFIITDDGSTDASLSILKRYAEQDSRIHLISRENRGIACTRNEMLLQARGEFVAVMDADDIALPDRLTRQVMFLRQNPDVVCVGSSYQLIDEEGRLLLTCFQMAQNDATIQKQLLAGFGSIHQPTVMFRRVPAIAVGGYNETMPVCEDLDLWMRLGEVGKLANLPQPLVQYRLHPNSVSEKNPTLEMEKAREACERAWKRRGIEGRFEAVGEWRPGSSQASRHRFMLQYGWWAFNSGQRLTAMLYGWRAIKILPFHFESWKLLVCAAIKPLPTDQAESFAKDRLDTVAGDRC
ncbi:MAG: glycosyltransferase [Leptolyngbyaceae cyanobacterium HOT.MB2.61]|jgi:glycosyltransferase involved in cell wall biosynthesis|nr:glycosyltransferase [Leptolyngbyaceae cyanobacterium HOT.MB2.61]